MKLFLVLILCTVAVHCREYHYVTPAVGFHQEDVVPNGQAVHTPLPKQTTVIKGNFGPDYEVTMIPSQKIFEQRLQENPQPAVVNQNNQQYSNQYTTITTQQQQQPGVLTSVNPLNMVNGQQFVKQYTTTNQQQTSLITNQFAGLNSNEGSTINPALQPSAAAVLTSPNPAYYPSAVNSFLPQPNNPYSTINSQQYSGVNTNLGSSANNQPLLSPPPPAGASPNPAYYNNNQYSTINPQQSGLITNHYSGLNSNTAVSGPNQPLLNPPPPPPPGVLTNSNTGYYPTNGQLSQAVHQYSTINRQQSSLITNQYSGLNSNVVPANAQHHLNQYSNQQQQQQHYQAGAIPTQYQYQQQQQQQQHQQYNNNNNNNNNAPNSNNLLNDLVNNNKYVSQSEASQLDVYPYKQLTIGNTRPFTRFTTKCNKGVGQCAQQNLAGNVDFQHQQVLKQSKAKIESISNKCSNKGNYDYSQNSLNSQNSQNSQISLTDNQITAKRNLARKGTDLRDRRQFAYTEQEIPQYPHN